MSFLTAIGGSKGGNKRKFIDGVNSEECQVSKFKFSPLPLSQNSQENQNDSNYEPNEKETRKSYKPTIVFEETRRRGQNIEAGGPSTSTQNNDESMDTENGLNPMKTSLRSKLQNFAAPRKEKEEDLDPIDQWLKMQAKTLPARDRFKDFVPNQPIVGKSSLANVPFSMMTHNQRERAVKENMGKPIPNYKKKHDDDESEDIKEIEDNNAKPASRQTSFASHNQQRVGKSSLINIPTHLSGKPLKENLAKPIPNYRKKFMKDKEESEETNQDDNTNNMQAKTCTVRPQFKTAHQLALASNVLRKNPGFNNKQSRQPASYNPSFKSPLLQKGEEAQPSPQEPEMDERLKNLDPQLIEKIENEIILHNNPVDWKDIAGLDFVKKSIKEIVVLPLMRPDIFHGLRAPPQGLLLFGPPGTGKTMIAKCIAAKSGFTFFSISSSSLTSKWIGEGEKMVRTLFAVARVRQPSVVFIDEIDSILSSRSDSEHESSRRMKTEFLVQLDGASSSGDERILIVGATNRPQDLDEAARRRLVKRLYVPLPEKTARASLINNLLATQNVKHELDDSDYEKIAEQTEGYSGADMHHLCREAAMGPIRSQFSQIEDIPAEEVRAINYQDFEVAMSQVKASVSDKDLQMYLDWNKNFGSTAK